MTNWSDDNPYPRELEVEVAAELDLVAASEPAEAGAGAQPWPFDPEDIEREEIGLRNILGAAEALDAEPRAE
jgi:hypothetical protein